MKITWVLIGVVALSFGCSGYDEQQVLSKIESATMEELQHELELNPAYAPLIEQEIQKRLDAEKPKVKQQAAKVRKPEPEAGDENVVTYIEIIPVSDELTEGEMKIADIISEREEKGMNPSEALKDYIGPYGAFVHSSPEFDFDYSMALFVSRMMKGSDKIAYFDSEKFEGYHAYNEADTSSKLNTVPIELTGTVESVEPTSAGVCINLVKGNGFMTLAKCHISKKFPDMIEKVGAGKTVTIRGMYLHDGSWPSLRGCIVVAE
jgi:hypothetical protein